MKLTPEQTRLKQFVEDNFCFDSLKQMGFWEKGTRRTDFEAQAKRICHYFSFESIYEYAPPEITVVAEGTVAVVEGRGSVTKEGAYEPGIRGLLTLAPSNEFECPACTCRQEVRNRMALQQKCKGCKRTLGVAIDMVGGIHVWEK